MQGRPPSCGGEKTEGKKGSATVRSPFNYGVPDGDPATCHAKPRNDEAVKSIAGSTVEKDCTLS